MDDLIKRSDAIKIMACEMYAEAQAQGYEVDNIEDFIPEAKAWMNDAPTADRPQGEWKDRTYGGRILHPWWESCECSQCEEWGSGAWNFCPNCGARMKGADDE